MLRSVLCSILFLISALSSSGQEVYYYGPNKRPVQNDRDAFFSKEVLKKSDRKYKMETSVLVNENWKRMERRHIKIEKDGTMRIRIKDERFFPRRIFRTISKAGPELYFFEELYKKEKIREGSSSTYFPLLLEGIVNEYHPNGIQKSVSIYQNNQLRSNQNWLPDGSPYIDSIFYSTDQEPVYLPGVAYFQSSLIQKMAEAKVNLDEYDDDIIIGWVVTENGQIDGVIPLKGKSKELNQILVESIAAIPGEWEPAILDGKAVRYFMSIPLTIFHNEAKFQEIEYSWGVLHYNKY
jgi:hypothetical protein